MDLHEPVLQDEAISALHIKKQAWYIDATLGSAGHTIKILEAGGNVIGIDADPEMLQIAEKRISEKACPGVFHSYLGNFTDIKKIANSFDIDQVDGILFDLGISTLHYSLHRRGFSFSKPDQQLDMRLNPETQSVTAADLVNALREDQLHEMFLLAMDYPEAKSASRLITQKRSHHRIETVGDLLDLFDSPRPGKSHPATKVFMALRMAVNTELENIRISFPQAVELLKPGGNLAVITFHSTEDHLVKEIFRQFEQESKGKIVTKKAIQPSEAEIERNAASRSAQLRVLQKI